MIFNNKDCNNNRRFRRAYGELRRRNYFNIINKNRYKRGRFYKNNNNYKNNFRNHNN